jgi:hypothetical protein
VLAALHDGLRRLKLVRGRGRKLFATDRGEQLASDPPVLARVLLADLGGADPFAGMVAATITQQLATGLPCEHADLVAPAVKSARRGGWHDGAVAVREDQHLTALHDAIQEAFGWEDDHLYSFWLDGKFWGDGDSEFTSPVAPDAAPQTADVPLAELDLSDGAKIAYVFDFGDEWRVRLALREHADADGGAYPRVLERKGTAPPQYGDE